MPAYDYRCNKCGEKFELRRSIFASSKDREKSVCPKCGSTETERVFSPLFSNGCGSGNSCYSAPKRRFG
jgi:putative FmdB family regulatory protein